MLHDAYNLFVSRNTEIIPFRLRIKIDINVEISVFTIIQQAIGSGFSSHVDETFHTIIPVIFKKN